MRISHNLIILLFSFVVIGCAGKPVIDVEITDAIFLNAEALEDKKVYVDIRNQSAIEDIDYAVEAETKARLEKKGFDVVNKPSQADIHLRAIILNIKKHDKEMNAATAFSSVALATGSGAIIGAVASGGDPSGAGIGAGVGVGVGVLGLMIAHAAQPEYWYGLVEVEIAEPQEQKTKSIQKVISRDSNRSEATSSKVSGFDELDAQEQSKRNFVVEEKESIIVSEGGKKKNRTKMMIRIRGRLDSKEAVEQVQKTLSHRLANFL